MAKKKNHELDAAIGLRLSVLRNAAEMSQADLGKHLGVTFQQVQKYESGKNGLSAGQLSKVCATFDIGPNEMMGWQGQNTTNGAPIWSKLVSKHGPAIEKFGQRLALTDTQSVLKLVELFNAFLAKEKADDKDRPRKSR